MKRALGITLLVSTVTAGPIKLQLHPSSTLQRCLTAYSTIDSMIYRFIAMALMHLKRVLNPVTSAVAGTHTCCQPPSCEVLQGAASPLHSSARNPTATSAVLVIEHLEGKGVDAHEQGAKANKHRHCRPYEPPLDAIILACIQSYVCDCAISAVILCIATAVI